MVNIGLSRLQHLLLALLLLAMTGCGASNGNLAGTQNLGSGKATVKLSYVTSKTAKTVAATASVATVEATVTGTALGGGAIPVVKTTLAGAAGGTINGIYPGTVTLGLIAKDSSGNVLYEGYALYVTVNPGSTTTLSDPIVMSPPLTKAQDAPCVQCHETTLDINGQNLVADFKQSGHYTNTSWTSNPRVDGTVTTTGTGCAGCHGPSHNDPDPAASGRCYQCHGSFMSPQHTTGSPYTATTIQKACGTCHQPHNTTQPSCVGCHSIPQNAGNGFVQDNNGVRAITAEFGKWSHHVTGVTLNDAHCTACHLEGTINAAGTKVVVDFNKHVVDNKVHLRNADTDADLAWDPASPILSTMDTFCLSCHDANGATSATSVKIQAFINANSIAAPGKTASAKNPFGDTISNRYDKLQRPGVVDAKSQFNPANNSHHAVLGKRYTGRSRVATDARHIASPTTFANNSSLALQGKRSTMYDAGNFNQLYTPLANADGSEVNTVASLSGRTGSLPLGDDSTLHCGDCHTVGQWKPGSSETANGSPTPVAIGAHGSNNEYLLRNSIGTDDRHTQNAFLQGNASGTVTDPATGRVLANGEILYTNPNGAFLVCYNCHSYNKYGSLFLGTGLNGGTGVPSSTGQPHAGEYDAQGRCNGVGNTLPFNGYTTGTATDGSQYASRFMGPVTKYSSAAPYAGEQNPDFGNIFGIQCLNCHNSGIGNAYGGIHGSANDTSWNNGTTTITPASLGAGAGGYYINGMGNATKVERFLPGLGNVMHVPGTLGGVTGGSVVPINTAVGPNYTYTTGGITNDTNWEQKQWQQTATTVINGTTGVVSNTASAGAGCYTFALTPAATPADIIKSDVASGLSGPSVTGEGGPASEGLDTWGGCDDHGAGQAKGNHGFLKRIIRPVTY